MPQKHLESVAKINKKWFCYNLKNSKNTVCSQRIKCCFYTDKAVRHENAPWMYWYSRQNMVY